MILILTFFWMGDSIIPISAQIKLDLAQNTNFYDYLVNLIIIITPNIFFEFLPVNSLTISLILTIFFIFINFTFMVEILNKKKKKDQIIIIILLISFPNVIYSIFIGNLYIPYYIWYLSLSVIIWIVILSYILDFLINKLIEKIKNCKKIKISRFFHYNQVVTFLVIMGIFISSSFLIIRNYHSEIEDNNLHVVRYNAAIWLKNNTNPEIIVGSWNSGEIAFYSNRLVINLDGLVNDIKYFNTILSNRDKFNSTAFLEYLIEFNITHIVDYNFYGFDPIQANYTLIKEFYFGDLQNPIQIWVR